MNVSFGTSNVNMLNPKVRRQKFGIGSFLILFFIGAVFAGIGLLILSTAKIDPSWTRVQGQVVDIRIVNNTASSSGSSGSTYAPIVEYKVNGASYQATSSSSSSFRPNIGSSREVAYNPQVPNDAKVVESGGAKAFLMLFPVIGIGMILLAVILLIRSKRRNKDIGNLQQTGQKLQGIITDIRSTGATNNVTTYKIIVSATDPSGVVQEYTSDSLSGIGGLAIADFRTNPIPIDVYVNPSNSKDYYVDISDVPNMTPDRIKQLIMQAGGQSVAPAAATTTTPPTSPEPPVNPVQ